MAEPLVLLPGMMCDAAPPRSARHPARHHPGDIDSGRFRRPNRAAETAGCLAELIPYAKLGMLEGVGHIAMLEDPEGTTEALYAWMRQPLVLR